MKNYCLLFIPFLFLLSSCTNSPEVNEASITEIKIIKPLGDQISKDLISSLQTELKKAIQTGGILSAIEVCNLKALPITDIIAKSTDNNVDIKRTTYKYRNKLNAPDDFEKLALDHFHSIIENKEILPESYIQKIEEKGEINFYYYRPLKTGTVCLNCHGTNEIITTQTQSIIQDYYPEDKAVGYKEGEFRGLIRIKFPDFQ